MSRYISSSYWTSCMLVVVSMVSTWWWSTTQANRDRLANESAILAAIRFNQELLEPPHGGRTPVVAAHPSIGSIEILREQLDQASRFAMSNWTSRRAAQEKILQWPAVVNANNDLAFSIAGFEPAREFSARARGIEVPELPNLMLIYGQQIPKHFLQIASRYHLNSDSLNSPIPIKAELTPRLSPSRLDWNHANGELWMKKVSKFDGQDGNSSPANVPLPRQAVALQEDLWLFETFLDIVERENRHALSHSQRVVMGIDHLYFGREAWVERDSKLSQPDPRLLARNSPEDLRETQADVREESEDRQSVHEPANRFKFQIEGPNAVLAPFHGRYAAADSQPLGIEVWSAILDAQDLPSAHVESTVCRRVPFRIALRVREQALPGLIQAMQSAELAFEIRQLRINRDAEYLGPGYTPDSRNAANLPNNRPQVETPGSSMGSMFDGESSTESLQRLGDGNLKITRQNVEVRRSDEVNVEFSGTVQIVNPVNLELIRRATKRTASELSLATNTR